MKERPLKPCPKPELCGTHAIRKKLQFASRQSLEIKPNDDNRYDFLTIVIVLIIWFQLTFILLYTRFNFEGKIPIVTFAHVILLKFSGPKKMFRRSTGKKQRYIIFFTSTPPRVNESSIFSFASSSTGGTFGGVAVISGATLSDLRTFRPAHDKGRDFFIPYQGELLQRFILWL